MDYRRYLEVLTSRPDSQGGGLSRGRIPPPGRSRAGLPVGLSLPPTWREAIIIIPEGVDWPLQPGMTFYSPVTLRHPGTPGIGFIETLAVTETGCEILTKHDRTLTVAPA